MKKSPHCLCAALCLVFWAGTAMAAFPQDLTPGLDAVVAALDHAVT